MFQRQVQHSLSWRALCWMNPVIIRGVHWVRLVPDLKRFNISTHAFKFISSLKTVR